jgi:hypothetical protein
LGLFADNRLGAFLREAQKPGFSLQFVRYAPEFRFYPLREQPTAVVSRKKLMGTLPFPLLEFHSDNGSEFINHIEHPGTELHAIRGAGILVFFT